MLVKNLKIILFMTVTLCFLFSASVTSVMAVGGFNVEPRVADNAEGLDAVFSPNGDSIEDKTIIGFTSTGVKGDYQVIVDTHGAGGVGPPNGDFDPEGDWSIPIGNMAGGVAEEENLIPLTIKVEWDGKDKRDSQRYVVDGTYKILVHIDYNPNGIIDKGDPSYDKRIIEATVDNTSPQISASVSPFSPNNDGQKDTTTIFYQLSENVLKLELTITILGVSTQLTAIQKQLQLTGGVLHKVTWDGKDGLGTIVKDDSYNCKLKGTDSGGNFAEIPFSIQVDTEPPVIQTINPADGYITNSPIFTITVDLDNKGGSEIDYDTGKTNIRLDGPSLRVVEGELSRDEVQKRLTFSLKQKLETTTQNGVYTIKVNATDEAGNSAKEKQAKFTFDTQKPTISSVKAGEVELKLWELPSTALRKSETIDIKVEDKGGSDIDFSTLNITLKGPSNQSINLTETTEPPKITVSYAGLVEEGIYTLEIVTLSDKAKNALTNQRYQFQYGIVVVVGPEIVSRIPEDGALVNQFEEVSVQIKDNSGRGIDFSEDKSYIVVKDKNGQKVSGKLSNDGNVTMKWRISTPLSRDGSKDGIYTVEVNLRDKANNTSTYFYNFIFDSQIPMVESTIPKEEFQKGKLESVAVVLYDETSGVDLSDTQVRLLDKTGAAVGASKATKIEDKRGTITLNLFTPRKTDGTDDGIYTIEVTPEDMAGNRASSPYVYRFYLVTQPPKIVSTTPEQDTFVNQLNTIGIQLLDYSGIGIDFEKSTINVKDDNPLTPFIKGDGTEIPGKLSNDEKENLTWQIINPLPRDGKQDGEYTVKVNVANKAGVSRTEQFKSTFDSQVPTIISTNPAKNSTVSNLSEVSVKLNDNLSGVDFVNTQVRLLDKNGSPIGATKKDNGVDTINLYFDPLRTDGSQDGVYTIEITPVDRASNRVGGASRIEFTYSTKDPEITSITIGAVAKLLRDNDFYNQVDIIEAQLLDYSGAGIDFDLPLSGGAGGGSTIVVKDSSGKIVAGKLSNRAADNQTALMTWQILTPLSRDGKEDGKYSAEVKAVDKAGNTFSRIFSFTFDSQIPTIVSTTPAKNSTVHSLSQVSVILDDTLSGIDFVNTVARLLDKNGAPIGATMKNNGVNTITLNFTERKTDGSQDGIYTIEITPADRAGNIAGSAYRYEFGLATQAPDITIITPEDKDFVNMVDTINVRLLDYSSAGIDFKKSTIILKNPDNINIPGTLSSVNGNILRFKISAPLLRDGSQDGGYKIEVTAQDLAGNTSVKTFSFTYATEPPEIVSIIPEDNAYVNQVNTIEVQFKDLSGAGIDFEIPLSGGAGGGSTVAVKNPSGEIVAGKLSGRAADNQTALMTWQISKPISRDGKEDGKYTVEVSAKDKAGNIFSKTFSFTFDSQIPTIISTIPEKGARVSSLNQIKVELQDVTSGVDFTNTQVRLLDRNNVVIGATKTDNGEDTITLTFAARKTDGTQDGIYIIEVTPADRAGNVAGSAYRYEFALATKLPEIVSVTPENNTFVSQINTIEAKFLDHSGEGIDFDNSSIVVKDLKGQTVSGKLSNDGNATLTWQILTPLPRDGGKDGTYTVEVTVQDKAGTTNTQTSNILFDSQVPTIVSTTPSKDSKVSTLSQIQVKLNDAISGVDTFNTQVRLLNPVSVNIGATKTDNGIDTITLDFNALKIDGSQDGIYTIEVTPADRAGNIGSSFRIEFAYVTKLPELVTVSIPDLSFVNRIDKIEATLQDHSGKGIDFDNSTIKLKNPGGEEVAVRQFDDDQNKIWVELVLRGTKQSLPTDGTVDGEYTVEYHIVDKVKTVVDYTTKFTYDSLPPSIVSVSPAGKEIIKTNKVTIELQVTDGKGSGVNFASSTVKLSGPAGVVSGHQSDDGISKITYLPGILPQAGKYTIEVTLVDRAGNSTIPLKSDFDYQIVPPRVLSITPANKSKLNTISEISAMLKDNSGAGLDFTSTGSSIRVIGPDGAEIEGVSDHEGDNLTLTLTLAIEGSDDGMYTVIVKPVDNTGTAGTEKRLTFIYDTEKPDIISVTNIDMTANVSLVNGEISRIEAVLADTAPPSGYAGNAGIDFDTSTIRLTDKSEFTNARSGLMGNIVSGKQGDNDTDKIWWQLSSPLSRGGDADGAYTIEVIAQDLAGNRETKTYSLLYDTLAPTIVSTTPKEGTTWSASVSADAEAETSALLTQVTVELEDAGSGVDLAKTSVQLVGPKGTIGANKADDGKNTIYLNFKALKVDGSDDGAYRIEVIPQDLAGNKYQSPVLFEFFYITQKPEIISTSPEEKTFVSQLNQISAVLEDHSGEGIDIKQSTIRLIAPDGKTVSGRQTDDRNVTVRWILEPPLPTDGTADGEYTISVLAVDKAGSQATYQLKFFYDSGIPKITKISPADSSAIYEPISKITITLTDGTGSGVDLAGTNVKLTDPDGAVISGNQSDDGIDTITYTFEELAVDGFYIIEVTPKDLSGNVSKHPFQYRFSLVLLPPLVKTVEVSGKLGRSLVLPQEYLNDITEITAEIEEIASEASQGIGLDLTDAGSRIRLIGPKGEVKGEQKAEGANTLVWSPILPLATDGSDDGDYTVKVLPVNKSGRAGDEVQFKFMYDTVAPEVDLDTIRLKLIETGAKNSLSEISVTVTDEQPSSGIDWKNVDDTWIRVARNEAISSSQENDKGEVVESIVQSDKDKTLILKLKNPLASDGSQDGKYTVIIAPKDKAGNTTEAVKYKFHYDTKPPAVDLTSLTISDPQLPDIEPKQLIIDPNDVDYPTSTNAQNGVAITAKITDDGLGVDLTQSTIVVEQPQGGQLTGILKQNGVDTIQFTTSRLTQEGFYRVNVVAVGLDRENIGINPVDSISATFLFETTKPVAQLTDYGGKLTLENEAVTLKGTAEDKGKENIPSSGVLKVEVGYEDAEGKYRWFSATDDSKKEEKPWSHWSMDFLPSESGEYEMLIRVTDEAGNYEIYEGPTLTFTVKPLSFRGKTYVWPNPISHSRGDVANFSFETNPKEGGNLKVTLSIYDIAGYLVYQKEFANVSRNRELANVKWTGQNDHGVKVASGVYIFTLEADDGVHKAGLDSPGRILVVK